MPPVAQTLTSSVITLSVFEHNNDSTLGVDVAMTNRSTLIFVLMFIVGFACWGTGLW